MPDSTPAPKGRIAHATAESAPSVPGRRSFFQYRDLGVMDASNGALRAQTMTAVAHMTEPTGWHYHECDGQFIYVLKGWVDLEFGSGDSMRIKTGESLFIPGGMKHNEFGCSEDLEILELSTPGEMGTVPCEPPA